MHYYASISKQGMYLQVCGLDFSKLMFKTLCVCARRHVDEARHEAKRDFPFSNNGIIFFFFLNEAVEFTKGSKIEIFFIFYLV